ncbi:MAG: phage holin family protein [Chryseobacterium sp.]
MILEILKHDYAALWLKLFVVSGAWGCVLIAILIDLYFGVKKSKALGEHTSSEGYRRSIQKFNYYYALLAFALIFDALLPISYYLPFPLSALPIVTLLGAVALVFTEAKSVREKGDAKLRRKTDASVKELITLLKDREDILTEFLKNNSNEQNTTSDN